MPDDHRPSPAVFTAKELAALLQIGREQAYTLMRLHGFRVGHSLRITVDQVAALVAQRAQPQPKRQRKEHP